MEKALLEIKHRCEQKKRKCMFSYCEEFAIKSHVLQKNGILKEISFKNHLIERVSANPFEMDNKGIADFQKKGINNVYTFNGFCPKHDTELFKQIETDKALNLENPNQQLLFCYRGLCQEIRRKEIALEISLGLRHFFPDFFLDFYDSIANGYEEGIKNLNFFKTQLEECIISGKSDKFYFETLIIEKIELCISVPLNVDVNDNESTLESKIPFVTSFLNVFPKGSCTYIIVGYHKDYPCKWTEKFVNKIKKSNNKEILKELSDLVTLRLEFWALSIPLYEKIDKLEIKKYQEFVMRNVFNHSENMTTDINLFKNV